MNQLKLARALAIGAVAAGCLGCSGTGTWGDGGGNAPKPPAGRDPSMGEGAPRAADPSREQEKQVLKDRAAHGDPDTLTGVLKGGIMGIGGEHTGWALSRPGERAEAEVDVSAVKGAASFVGKRVVMTGRWVDRKYVERGAVKVFIAETIAQSGSRS